GPWLSALGLKAELAVDEEGSVEGDLLGRAGLTRRYGRGRSRRSAAVGEAFTGLRVLVPAVSGGGGSPAEAVVGAAAEQRLGTHRHVRWRVLDERREQRRAVRHALGQAVLAV